MSQKIRIGILGYGNLGRGTELAIRQNPDMVLSAVFTRRDPKCLTLYYSTAGIIIVDEIGIEKIEITKI